MSHDLRRPRSRSPLGRDAARERYLGLAEVVALKRIQADAASLDAGATAIGPFARIDASAVAALDGKTRGVITNLFGSQAAFQAATMQLSLQATDAVARVDFPDPADHRSLADWLEAFFAGESRRGPTHGEAPSSRYDFLWVLWLSTVPYGLWSDRVAEASMAEHRQLVARYVELFDRVLARFRLRLSGSTTLEDLALATANLVEGAWLDQCQTTRHPLDASRPVADLLGTAGPMLWRGAVEAAPRGVTNPRRSARSR